MSCVKGGRGCEVCEGRRGMFTVLCMVVMVFSWLVYLPYCSMLLVTRCVQCFQPFPDGVFFEVRMLEENCQ